MKQTAAGPGFRERVLSWIPSSVMAWIWIFVLVAMAVLIYRYISRRHRARTVNLFASAPMGMALVLVALVAGALSQFYASVILKRVPLVYAGNEPTWAAQAFWLSVVLTVFIGLSYYAATGHQQREQVSTLQAHTSDLVSTLRTLPPEGFMRDFPRLCSAMMAAYSEAVLNDTREEARRAIRVALRTAADMARSFDRGDRSERYSATVMRFQTRDELPRLNEWTDEDWALYPSGFRPERILGALVLDPELASFADTDAPVPGVTPIRIVVPDPPRDTPIGTSHEGRLRLLPGAALAYFLARPYNATDTRKIRESAETEELSLPEAVLGVTERYFRDGPGNAVRSFVSLPLFENPGEMKGDRVGVLNVESSESMIFGGDDEKVRQFALAIAPVHFVIVSLLAYLGETVEDPGA